MGGRPGPRWDDAGTRDEREAGVVDERSAVVEAAGVPRGEREGHRLREHDDDDEELYQADESRSVPASAKSASNTVAEP